MANILAKIKWLWHFSWIIRLEMYTFFLVFVLYQWNMNVVESIWLIFFLFILFCIPLYIRSFELEVLSKNVGVNIVPCKYTVYWMKDILVYQSINYNASHDGTVVSVLQVCRCNPLVLCKMVTSCFCKVDHVSINIMLD